VGEVTYYFTANQRDWAEVRFATGGRHLKVKHYWWLMLAYYWAPLTPPEGK
jgi:hypothetical protein